MVNQQNKSASALSGRRQFLTAAGTAVVALAAGHSAEAQESPARKPPTKRAFQLALASYTFHKFPLDKTLAMTNRVDLKNICLKSFHLPLDAKPEEIAAAAAKVKAAGLTLYGCGVVSMVREAEVHQAFEYAKVAGMKTIIAAPRPELLPLVNKMVRQYDIQIAIHNHGPDTKMFPTPKSIYDKVRELDQRIGICMDIGHTMRSGVDPVEAARLYADRLLDIHIKDVSAAKATGKTVECGRGVIDLPGFLRMLVETNYHGMVSFEHEKDPDNPLPGLAESVGYVRGVLAVI